MPELPGLWSISPIAGLIGLLILLFWMLATGRLLTRSQHVEITAAQKNRGDEWKETALEYRSTIRELESRSVVLPSKQAADQIRGIS